MIKEAETNHNRPSSNFAFQWKKKEIYCKAAETHLKQIVLFLYIFGARCKLFSFLFFFFQDLKCIRPRMKDPVQKEREKRPSHQK